MGASSDSPALRLPLGSGAASLVERSLAALARLTGYDVAYLTVVDEERGVQQVLHAHRQGALDIAPGLAVPWRETLCRRAFEAGTLGCREVAESFPDAEAAIALGVRGYAMAPIRIGDRLEGTLCLASREARALDPGHREVLEVFAELIAAQLARELALAALLHAQGELARAALTDPLTGLPNRRALFAELSRRLPRRPGDVPLCFAFVDLNDFKSINDRYGHAVGDRFLIEVARRLRAAAPAGAMVARYAGDEFAVLAEMAGESGADLARCEQGLGAALAGRYELDGAIFDHPGASVGVAFAEPGETADQLIARADLAMYQRKRAPD